MARRDERNPSTLTRALAAVVLALSLVGCATGGVYHDTFEGTRGALDAVRRHSGNSVDPEALRAITTAAAEGLRDGAGLPHGDLFPELSELATYGAIVGIGRGLDERTTPATLHLLDALLRRAHGEGGPSIAASLLDDVPPELERLSRSQLTLFRRELHLTLDDTRGEMRLLTHDLDAELQAAVAANGEQLGLTLRNQVMPAVGDGLRTSVAPGVEELSRSATRGAARGLQQGLDADLTPALGRMRRELLGEQHITMLWIVIGLVIALLVGLGFIAKSVLDQRKQQRVLMGMLRGRSGRSAPRRRIVRVAR